MPLFDKPLDELRTYKPERDEPADFDDFWSRTLQESGAFALDATFTPYDGALQTVDVYDVRFAGFGGHPISGWLLVPAGSTEPLPTVVKYIGYSGGREFPHQHLETVSAGFATFVMDTRGHIRADTPDPVGGSNSQVPGVMTRGILNVDEYYYRRVYTDAARAVEAAKSHPLVDGSRIVVSGGSQGGGIATAAAGLVPGLAGAMIDVPFLTGFRRATEIVDSMPYGEITTYLSSHRDQEEQVFATLGYFDGMNFAARATAPALYSVGLMDMVCPPSTVFASFNHYAGGPKEIRVWPFNQHEGGQGYQVDEQLRWLRALLT